MVNIRIDGERRAIDDLLKDDDVDSDAVAEEDSDDDESAFDEAINPLCVQVYSTVRNSDIVDVFLSLPSRW
jgi:hypothetical protein